MAQVQVPDLAALQDAVAALKADDGWSISPNQGDDEVYQHVYREGMCIRLFVPGAELEVADA